MATVTGTKRHLAITSTTYDSSGDVVVGGNLTVEGTTTTLDTANLLVEDKNIIIGNVSTPSDTTADGGGITLKGASDYTINWVNANNRWEFNQGIHSSGPITSAGQITGTELEGTSLDINGNADISGNITTATWAGAIIPEAKLQNQSGTNTGDQDLSGYSLTSHNHDDRYYTETELDAGQLDNRYYTETEVNNLLSNKTELNHLRSLGTTAFTGTATTAGLISEMESDGAFDSYSSLFKTSWSYAGNFNLGDAGRFTETAGSSWITWTDNSSDSARGNITALAIAPNSGGSAGKVFIYNDQGSGYSPGWREVWTSTSDGAGSGLDADLLDGNEASAFALSSVVNQTDFVSAANGGTLIGDITINGNIHLDSDSAQLQLGDDNDMQIFHNGTNGEINNATGNFTIDSAGDIILDAAGDNIELTDNGTLIGKVNMTSQNLTFISSVSNKDMIFRGNDGGTFFTAFSLDMSTGGTAAFADDIVVNGNQIRFINDAASSYVSAADALILQSDYNTGENKPIYLQPSAVTELTVATGQSTFVGDVGIGTSSPSSKLEVYASGSTVLDIQGSQGQLFSITDDLTGDLFTVSDISGVPIFNVNASGTSYFDDKVGIGETSPSHKIDIKQGELRILNNQLDPQIILQGSDMGKRWVLSQDEEDNIGSTGFYIAEGTNVDANDALLYLTPTGELGLGTTSPLSKLHIKESANPTSAGYLLLVQSKNGGGDYFNTSGFYRDSSQNMQLKLTANSSSNTVLINSAGSSYFNGGNVGIGMTGPGEKLQVAGNMFLSNSSSKIAIGENITGTPNAGYNDGNNGPGQLIVAGYASSSQFPGVMTIMNRDSTISANQDLGVIQFVGKDDATNGYCSSQIRGTSAGSPGSGNTGGGILRFLTNPGGSGIGIAERMRIASNGNVGIGTTNPTALIHTATPTTGTAAVNNELRIQSTHMSGYGGKAIVNLLTSQYGYSGIYMGDNTTFSSQPSYIEHVDSSDMLKYKSSGNHTMLIGTTTKMSINSSNTYFSSNNVGIKTTNPSTALEVSGTTTTQNLAFQRPTGDNQFMGEIVTFGSQSGIAQGDIVAYNSSGQWIKAQANSGTTSKNLLGVAMGTTAAAGILLRGFVRDASFGNQTPSSGQHLYLSTSTAGDYQTAVPSTTGHVARVIGYSVAPTNEEMYFCPDNTFVEIA